jgi:glyoxylase-like metal-dependent hydrolase (beta-lactamase superfamily II)
MKSNLLREDDPLQCRVIPVTHVQQNCSVIWCAETLRGAVVDPGGEIDRIRAFIDEQGIEVERLLVTHGHPDHAGATADLAAILGVPIEGPHRAEARVIARMQSIAAEHGFEGCRPFTPDRWLEHGDTIQVGNQQLLMLHCPGHTDGHAVYYSEAAKLAFVGDILFKNAVGATGTPENHLKLMYSIRRILFPLGDDVVFVPGHDMLSTFGDERVFNPYVSDFAAEDYEHVFDDPQYQQEHRLS